MKIRQAENLIKISLLSIMRSDSRIGHFLLDSFQVFLIFTSTVYKCINVRFDWFLEYTGILKLYTYVRLAGYSVLRRYSCRVQKGSNVWVMQIGFHMCACVCCMLLTSDIDMMIEIEQTTAGLEFNKTPCLTEQMYVNTYVTLLTLSLILSLLIQGTIMCTNPVSLTHVRAYVRRQRKYERVPGLFTEKPALSNSAIYSRRFINR